MKIFFSGIGGAGLGPLAQICLDCGWEVVGSDVATSLITQELEKRGVTVSLDQSGVFLEEEHKKAVVDLYVYSSAVKEDNAEFQKALQLGIPTSKRSGLINKILSEKQLKLLAVAGTHGKTTTTAMCVWLFKQLGVPVSYSIGTTLNWAPAAAYETGAEWFVYECDEFDRNFLDFYPDISLVTSFDYDHPDTYPTEQEYRKAFQRFVSQSSRVALWSKDVNAIFGEKKPDNTAILVDSEVQEYLYLQGQHNRKNATLAIHTLTPILPNDFDLIAHMNTFPGTVRRFEKLKENLYSDYAHHPTEIRATIQMAKELSDKVVVVYQPHQNLRQYEVKDQYTQCFEGAKRVYWLPTYLSRDPKDIAVLTPEELTQDISNTEVILCGLDDALSGDLKAELAQGMLVVGMGAGSIDAWLRNFATSLRSAG